MLLKQMDTTFDSLVVIGWLAGLILRAELGITSCFIFGLSCFKDGRLFFLGGTFHNMESLLGLVERTVFVVLSGCLCLPYVFLR